MRIIWDAKAYDDLDGLIDYIAELSPRAAEKTISQIQKVASLLATFPNLEEKVDESGLHSLVVSNTPYIIFYRVFPDYVNSAASFTAASAVFLSELAYSTRIPDCR